MRILQKFEYVSKYWEGEQKVKSEIVMRPADGVKVGFWEAKSGKVNT